ncbi:MAG: transglutaminase domain-containing protein [Planctomycetes bacterium]|nr:transglutaminase domain-containing protein [Planctomycetota bacterium]
MIPKTQSLVAGMLCAAAVMLAPAVCPAADFGFEMGDKQEVALVCSLHVYNVGSEPARNVRIYANLPRNMIGQTILSLDFIPQPQSVKMDRWTQDVARWRVAQLNPGEHFFALWVARGTLSEVTYDLPRLRKGGLPIPLPIRLLYQWSSDRPAAESYFEQSRLLADYVRKTASQEASGLPFYRAITRPESTFAYARAMTKLCFTNDIPCRTVGAYVRAVGSDFSIDPTGSAWNEIYFPQSGWVPASVTDPRGFGRKPNNCVVVQTIGRTGAQAVELWGRIAGGNAHIRVAHRGCFSNTRDRNQHRELIKVFQSLRKTTQTADIGRMLLFQARAGDSLALALIEPYLYHVNLAVVEIAAAAIADVRQSQAALMLVDAMGPSADADKILIKHAEALTKRNFGRDKEAWRTWIRRNVFATPY